MPTLCGSSQHKLDVYRPFNGFFSFFLNWLLVSVFQLCSQICNCILIMVISFVDDLIRISKQNWFFLSVFVPGPLQPPRRISGSLLPCVPDGRHCDAFICNFQWLSTKGVLEMNKNGACAWWWQMLRWKTTASYLLPGDGRWCLLSLVLSAGRNIHALLINWRESEVTLFLEQSQILTGNPTVTPQVCRGDWKNHWVFQMLSPCLSRK